MLGSPECDKIATSKVRQTWLHPNDVTNGVKGIIYSCLLVTPECMYVALNPRKKWLGWSLSPACLTSIVSLRFLELHPESLGDHNR